MDMLDLMMAHTMYPDADDVNEKLLPTSYDDGEESRPSEKKKSCVGEEMTSVFLNSDASVRARISQYSKDVFVIETTDADGTNIPIPPGFILEDTSNRLRTPLPLKPLEGRFFVSWAGTYRLTMDGVVVMEMTSAKRSLVYAMYGVKGDGYEPVCGGRTLEINSDTF